MIKIADNIAQRAGNTPLARINKLTRGLGATIAAKLDQFKTCGSVKGGVVKVGNDGAFKTARQVVREEGIFCGISSGAANWAALETAQGPGFKNKMIVVIIPSLGDGIFLRSYFYPL
jgi:cysteine synthase